MKLNRHDCAVFGIGAAVGGLLAWAGSYIFFRKKLDQWDRAYEDLQKENHEIVKSSEKRINELREANKEFASKIIKHDDIPTQASNTGRDKGVLSRQQRDDIRKKLEKNYEGMLILENKSTKVIFLPHCQSLRKKLMSMNFSKNIRRKRVVSLALSQLRKRPIFRNTLSRKHCSIMRRMK